jgi:FixJ family two-component response regulator
MGCFHRLKPMTTVGESHSHSALIALITNWAENNFVLSATHATLQDSFKSLSARERDVVARVAAGELNKQIAADLGVSEVTIKVHRANAMRKLRAKSVAELVRMTDLLGIMPSKEE